MNQIGDRSLPTDLRDLKIFLQRSFPDISSLPLYVERHYGSGPREIAFVVVGLPDRVLRRQVRAFAEAGLGYLGYEIRNQGRDVYDVWPDSGEVSAHNTLRAMNRFGGMETAGSGNDAPGATGYGLPGRSKGGADN
jgi:hypothetical protein